MCLQDMAIERKLATRTGTYSNTANGWLLPANPTRHSVVINSTFGAVEVVVGQTNAGLSIANMRDQVWNGGGLEDQPFTLVLRVEDYGDKLCGPLFINNQSNSPQQAPFETYPTADLDALIERALPQ